MAGPALEAPVAPPGGGPAGEAEATVLVVDQVSVGFGGLLALDEVSMSVGGREVVGVIGPNGAGKTTLFNVICGFVHPGRGTLIYRGRRLRRHHPHDLAKLGIARTLQGVGLYAGLTVHENVMLGAQARLHSDLASSLPRPVAFEPGGAPRRRAPWSSSTSSGRPSSPAATRRAALRDPEADRAGAGAHGRAPAAAPRRAGQRALGGARWKRWGRVSVV